MIQVPHARTAEDLTRIASYVIGASWAVVFTLFTPSAYQSVINHQLIWLWTALSFAGCLVGAFGALTGRDTKVELSGLYLILTGSVLYLVAQFGFFPDALPASKPLDRVAFTCYIAWHASLVLPRLVGLEAYRRSVRRHARSSA